MTDQQNLDAYMSKLSEPQKSEVQLLRNIITKAGPQLNEHIKWNAPSYYYKELDMAAFNLYKTGEIRIIFLFPKGYVNDPRKILTGDWDKRRLISFKNIDDIESKKSALIQIVKDWINLIDNN